MKKLILSLLFSCASVVLFSQNSFGIFAGINNSSLSDGFLKKVSIDKVFSYNFGGVYQYNLTEKVSFRPKLVISLQGDRKEGNGGSGPILGSSIDYKLTYINLPIDFKFFSKPFVSIGPQVGYLLKTKKGDSDFGNINKKLDYGLNFGLGYEFNKLFIEFNIYQGMAKLMQFESSSNRYNYYKTGVTNTVLQLSLGYYFK